MSIPFSDIQKQTNDLLGRDFYHLSQGSIDIKSTAPNGVNFTVKGKTGKDNSINASIESKYTDKASGLTLTQGWNNANSLDTKIELSELLTPGLKTELITSLVPNGNRNAKLNFYYQHSIVNTRLFFDLLKGPLTTADLTFNHDGFIVGGELGYDISSAKVNKYNVGLGYKNPLYSIGLTASNNLSVFSAAYYHKISPLVEAGAKATWDSVKSSNVNVEFATKYKLDSSSSIKAKISDSGLTALSYQQVLRPGVTLGLGASFDALKLSEPVHKLGFSLSFAA
ncbi:mitochondrial outer membrane protein porin [[Candida] jaroonii]|uniref:Mitochondrial outer membrane protein porin n=1 Tax=[Candida] jaroonii TaxID=467808 RepID=A0ACA9YD47_9ASCO|nr:mitochondrial outer membrane protein porin [[Candida] jaroonii]